MEGSAVTTLAPREVQDLLLHPMAVMGQPWTAPDGPDGWPEEATAWGTPQGLAMRINWALSAPAALVDTLPDPRDLLAAGLADTASEALAWAVPRAESPADGVALILASADFNRR